MPLPPTIKSLDRVPTVKEERVVFPLTLSVLKFARGAIIVLVVKFTLDRVDVVIVDATRLELYMDGAYKEF